MTAITGATTPSPARHASAPAPGWRLDSGPGRRSRGLIRLDTVTGATSTSEGYRHSLQSAIDQLG
ncbi:hypothetical protein L1785_08295 [Antribacter sp. KLBMP9083]|uniref:FMN-binding protein n=1 Tax=Antribacter soli TaxID=2910976 RepID=A0AA41QCL9_9MICO|nr:hypothetical protein [Antribacter soli]MCF4120979.1 hypothetical protein [Antribacter soli]